MKPSFVIVAMSLMTLALSVRAEGTLTWTGEGEKASWAEAGNWSDGSSAPASAPMKARFSRIRFSRRPKKEISL